MTNSVILMLILISFCLGLVICPLVYHFRSIDTVNQYIFEFKLKIPWFSFETNLYNPLWNYERLTKED